MNLLIERLDETNCLVESTNSEKNYYIEGIFMQSNVKNRNGRVYPKPVMESAVQRYQDVINSKLSHGMLNHPTDPQTDLSLVSHIVESLRFDGDNIIGKARICKKLPMGKIAAGLIEEGIKLGVSSRGVGTVKSAIVQNDFNLIAVDIVGQPSAPDAWVSSIMENKEWVFENGLLVEKVLDETKSSINNIYKTEKDQSLREEKILSLFNKYLKQIKV